MPVLAVVNSDSVPKQPEPQNFHQSSSTSPPFSPAFNPMSLYVGDLHPSVTEVMLFELFNNVSNVCSLRICRDIETRRSLGYAYVNFFSTMDALRALETLNHTNVKGRLIRVMWSQRDPSLRKSGVGNVYIKNLEKDIDNKCLYDTFSVFGKILSCKVCPNGDSSYGFIHFENEDSAKAAIERVNGKLLNGLKVYVGPFIPRKQREHKLQVSVLPFTNIYVKNIPEKWDVAELNSFFLSYGEITSCVVAKDSKGVSRCFGFVNFLSPNVARTVIEECNGVEVEGKILYVGRAQKRQERLRELQQKYLIVKKELTAKTQGHNLYVKNLAETVDSAKLKEVFAPYGTITSAHVMYNEKNTHRGFGFVCFASAEEASKALAAVNNTVLDGKSLYVAFAQTKEQRKELLAGQFVARLNTSRIYQPPYYYLNGISHPRGNFMYPGAYPPRRFIPPPMASYYMPPVNSLPRAPYANRNGRVVLPGMDVGHINSSSSGQPPLQPINTELNASELAKASEAEQRFIIGNKLYHRITSINSELAPKVTGMLLEMDISELLHLLESPEALLQKVKEAVDVIEEHARRNPA
ncbi:polyadenylate-binding protein 4-like isoform X1 [Zophobas morio]|jgi:polyadenylate-binding protein|uniref:polyadenylate-binding protein 4-like isoform X1 n=1 Tax=Zophobas morio TaxID=2755281 RepID=UPI00308342A6